MPCGEPHGHQAGRGDCGQPWAYSVGQRRPMTYRWLRIELNQGLDRSLNTRGSGWPNWAGRRRDLGKMAAMEEKDMTALTDNMTFGTFMAPFHRVGENPTLALERDLR